MSDEPTRDAIARPSAEEVRARIIAIVAECGELPPEKLRPGESLHRFGIDSLAGVNIAYEIEQLVGRELPSSLITEHDTIDKLVEFVLGNRT